MVLRSCVDNLGRNTIGLSWFHMHTMNCIKFALQHDCNLYVQLTLMESSLRVRLSKNM